ncbi:hypothetical protein MKO06_10290 [Gramella sp. GC03-9]|uniref:Uncharacterized protein n=1 Tax=Christiangramia oceanisediminis TaxID=2920386 RepID=A0A9X2KXW0_9FLAO|nr:hypothetical protein [Gramella oceanisediminis]MCP9200299.1 hypothetical protein [Gramella oceanisediminis]
MNLAKNILFVFTAFLIFLPSGLSLSHIFSDHAHAVCTEYAEYHYHKKQLDCDLQKFKKDPALKIDLPRYEPFAEISFHRFVFDYYHYLNDFEALSFSLRGPPILA